ncbi:hypothetical protein P43SY_000196 [Pythium insidiosum]|uniref:Uncharacterized protein n=1 Tax=Pythium insidiosum TaxID=114742 RepID=A0AAD5MAG9_PYTIN|nr:hypothetical protein P43SY_000196 [Pythium insidiosum]KAJ0411457.1 hypothetical protein ATCC90586_008506 [Pythium insidiosum]
MAKMKTANATLPLLQHRSPPAKGTSASSPTKPKAYGAVEDHSNVGSPTSSYGSTAASSPTRPRVASEELIVPHVEQVSSVYYGVDAFSPTLVDFYTLDQKRLTLLSATGFFLSSTLQFMDPMAVIFPFQMCMTPIALGCVVGLCSSVLGFVELESSHKRHKHPEYGLLKNPSGYV